MDTEEETEEHRVNLAGDPSNGAMVQRNLHHHLPLNMRLEIVSRLPIDSLIRFKTTSRAGYDLIADPGLPPLFRKQVSDSNPCLILFRKGSAANRGLCFVGSEDYNRRVRNIDPPQQSEVDDLVGSSHGLLCLSLIGGSSESHSLLIYNPFVGDAVRVPPAHQFLNESEDFGFGFHPRTGEFKVVRIVLCAPEELVVQVFTIGTTEWRTIGAPPPQLLDVIGPPQALVEGSLHWLMVVRRERVDPIFGIISFEFADEVFEQIPHPPCEQFVSRGYSLSVLNGCLSAAGFFDALHFGIWVMKQYHVKESWVKQFSFEWPSSSTIFPRPICALKNGEILLQNNDSLVSYDPVEKRFKTLQMSGLPYWFDALPFLPSLFSARATMNLQP
ncbi:hypothetical protein SLA2020_244620 [Shorea laevis]